MFNNTIDEKDYLLGLYQVLEVETRYTRIAFTRICCSENITYNMGKGISERLILFEKSTINISRVQVPTQLNGEKEPLKNNDKTGDGDNQVVNFPTHKMNANLFCEHKKCYREHFFLT
jgi:hypothetical protein